MGDCDFETGVLFGLFLVSFLFFGLVEKDLGLWSDWAWAWAWGLGKIWGGGGGGGGAGAKP